MAKKKPNLIKKTHIALKEDQATGLGRPSLFNEAIRDKILELAKLGKTNNQIADIIGVHVRTIENWCLVKKDLLWSLRESKQIADDLVEASLFSRAVGYSHKSEKIHFDKDGNINRANTIEQYPPDTNAAIFWLKNRQPNRWKDKTEVEMSGHLDSLTDEQIEEKLKELSQK